MHFVTWSQVKIYFPIFSMIFHDSFVRQFASAVFQDWLARDGGCGEATSLHGGETSGGGGEHVGKDLKMVGKCWENVGKMLGKCWENGRMLTILIVFLHLPSEIAFFWLGLGNKAIASCMSVEGGYQYYDGCKNRDPVLRKNSDSKQQLIIIDLRSTHCHGLMTATAECRGLWLFGWMSEKQR